MVATTFEVWAPYAGRVEVVVEGRRHAMKAHERDDLGARGWWAATLDVAPTDATRYGYALEGGPVRPDPRSPWQPDGIDGLSALVDHDAFSWRDGDWAGFRWPGAVLYELHVGTFTPDGTFDAAIERLAHLVELGVDAVELMPVAEFPGRHGWGYDGVFLFAPHHRYGGPEGFKRFVDACHRHGLGVALDVVYNHLGPAGNHLAEFGPYFTDRYQTAWGAAINVDGPGSDDVRRFVIDNACMWLREYHLDGLRLDAVHAIVDTSGFHLLEQLAAEVDELASRLGRPLTLVAESDRNDPRLIRSRARGGYGLDAVWADDWHHGLHTVLTGESAGYYEDYGSIDDVLVALSQGWIYDGRWSPHRRRTVGGSTEGLSPSNFVVAMQNHDQIGNRALGERSSMLMRDDQLRTATALLLLSPFVALLFQGEEWAAATPFQYFTDHADPELGRAVREGRRREFSAFGWVADEVPDPQDEATFVRSKLDWSELDQTRHARMLEWYRALIALRKELSVPDPASPIVRRDEPSGAIVVERSDVVLVANLQPDPCRVALDGANEVVLVSDDAIDLTPDGLSLAGDAVAVLRRLEGERT